MRLFLLTLVLGSSIALAGDGYDDYMNWVHTEFECKSQSLFLTKDDGTIYDLKNASIRIKSLNDHIKDAFIFEIDGTRKDANSRFYGGAFIDTCKWNNGSLICDEKNSYGIKVDPNHDQTDPAWDVILSFPSGKYFANISDSACIYPPGYKTTNATSFELFRSYLIKDIDPSRVKFRFMQNGANKVNPFRAIVLYGEDMPCYYVSMKETPKVWARAFCDATGTDTPDYPDFAGQFYKFDLDQDGDLDVIEKTVNPDHPFGEFIFTAFIQ